MISKGAEEARRLRQTPHYLLALVAEPGMTITVGNPGSGLLHIGALSLSGGSPADFLVVAGRLTNCANVTQSMGATCSVQVAFRPTTPGGRSAFLVIASDDPASPTAVGLFGVGT